MWEGGGGGGGGGGGCGFFLNKCVTKLYRIEIDLTDAKLI